MDQKNYALARQAAQINIDLIRQIDSSNRQMQQEPPSVSQQKRQLQRMHAHFIIGKCMLKEEGAGKEQALKYFGTALELSKKYLEAGDFRIQLYQNKFDNLRKEMSFFKNLN